MALFCSGYAPGIRLRRTIHAHAYVYYTHSRRLPHATARSATAAAYSPAPQTANMDIDDLLAEVSVDSTSQETRDLQELTRCWVAERVAPEVLPWPEELMDRVLGRIARQVSLTIGRKGMG